ncbi:MAG: TlpA disulfide reductase family protein [Ginsengibacter sp.]
MAYPDLTQYDVTKRSKTLTIDSSTLLPVAIRNHQESLSKVRDLYYEIREIHINDTSFHYQFSSPGFLREYTRRILQPGKPVIRLKGSRAPAFTLYTFDNRKISLSDLHGKIVLLDFWEVWGGPCMESMPKVQKLYDTYSNKGLQVLGITNDLKQLAPARLAVQKRGLGFPMLIGNERIKKDYQINAIPLYVLIDKTGKITSVAPGYSDELETAIQKLLLNN